MRALTGKTWLKNKQMKLNRSQEQSEARRRVQLQLQLQELKDGNNGPIAAGLKIRETFIIYRSLVFSTDKIRIQGRPT
jgi:hypothetical protein